MAYLKNTWVGYLQRSAPQILDSILIKLGLRVPEMTDVSPSNPYVRNLEQFAGIHEQLGYYVDNAARETFVTQARLYSSLIKLARLKDYQVIGNLPFTADVQFISSIPAPSIITIPAGTVLTNAEGSISYRTLTSATIAIGDTASTIVSASQSESFTGVTVMNSVGTADLAVTFTDKIVHNSIRAYWDAVAWNSKTTLAYSSPVSTDYVQSVNEDGNVVLYFGNESFFGQIPVSGQTLTVDYDTTLGADGKVEAGELNTIPNLIPSLPVGVTISVFNIQAASGGSDIESIADLKRHIPMATRTKERAVTFEDFIDVVNQAPGVAANGIIYDGKRDINQYIVPIGGGIASGSLITSTQAYIDARKMITTHPVIKAAGELHVQIDADVTALSSYSNVTVKATVLANLLDFLSYTNQTIRGKVHLSDVYQTIEDSKGVAFSNVTKFAIVPFAQPLASSPPLVWTRTVINNTLPTQYWKIVFVTGSSFKLVKNATVVGTYSTGATVTTPQLTFVIPAGAYTAGDSYEFYTYPYNANSVSLLEPSLPVSIASDITLNVTGGY